VHHPVLAFLQANRHVEPTNDELSARVPWPANFPEVIIHTDARSRDSHPGYAAAKSGNADAGLMLAADLLSPNGLASIKALIAGRPTLRLPVVADELTGFNAIPDARAQVLGNKLGLQVIAGEIVQTNKVGHTRAPEFQRLVTPAPFEGHVQLSANDVDVDDHIGLAHPDNQRDDGCLKPASSLTGKSRVRAVLQKDTLALPALSRQKINGAQIKMTYRST
jgi:hypothetical protein